MKFLLSHLRAALAICILLLAAVARADQPPMVFKHLSTAQGLSQVTVTAVLQDSQGFIWLATENGLNRYDGNQIKRYYRERNKVDGLANDFIRAMDEDKAGNLWLATEGSGLVVWDRLSDTFKSYRHIAGDPNSLASDSIRDVLIDRDGQVWAATRDHGLDRLDPITGKITHFVHDSRDPGSLSSDQELHALLEDRDGSIWVGTAAGLDRYHASGDRFEHFLPPLSVGGVHSILSVIQDHRGAIWLGSFNTGLQRLDPANGQFTSYTHSKGDPASISHNQVSTVFEDSAKRLWIGTGGGLNLFNRSTNNFQTYAHDRTRSSSLAGSSVRTIGEDRNGLLWVGTYSNGVSRWNSHSWALGHRIPQWLPDASMINAFADADKGDLWVGTTVGLLLMGQDGLVNKVTVNQSLDHDTVMSLLSDRKNQLWIGTMSDGLSLRRTDGSISTFRADAGGEQGLGSDGIMSLYEDRSGRIWIGTFEGGVSVYNPETGAIRRFLDVTGKSPWFERIRATAIREDHQGRIWVGTTGDGLLVIDPDQGLLHQFRHNPNQPGSLSSNRVFALHVDAQGSLWVGTGGGGVDYLSDMTQEFETLRFENISQADGLSNDVIYAVAADSTGQLWLPSNNGIMRLNPKTRSIRTYHASHGAQSDEFSFGAYLQSSSGRMLFAGTGGYNDFDPLQLLENEVPPSVVITNIEVQNKPLSSEIAVPMLKKLELDYHEKAISLEFAALNFTDPRRNQFAYRLVGFDEDWIQLRNEHRVSYTNLAQGSYIFQVKAAGADLVWNEEGVQLAITVRPAPWQTWWAYAIYTVLALLLAVIIYRQQTRRLREQQRYAKQLAHEVKARTTELNQRNLELAEASSAKSNFLARMSHEIRTPMNGVMGMAELLSATDLNPQQHHYTHTISRSARTLLQIINDILDLSKIEAGQVVLEAQPFGIEQIINDCLALVAPQAKKKGVDLVADVDPDIPNVLIGDPLRIHQVLTNFLDNALKFTTEGEILLRAHIKQSTDERAVARLEVTDTGIGIEEQALGLVFDAFSQADETTTRRFGGTGLGLSICKQLVELMDGQIGVSSDLGVGSTFWCELPFAVIEATPMPNTAQASAAIEPEPDPAQATNTPMHVLVVEDNTVNQMVAEGTLSHLGYKVSIASDGQVAIGLMSTEHFDIVLMDCQMPGMDGFEATRYIRAAEHDDQHIPIIGLTAHASDEARQACLSAGMDDFISKPYSIDEVAPVLLRWLEWTKTKKAT